MKELSPRDIRFKLNEMISMGLLTRELIQSCLASSNEREALCLHIEGMSNRDIAINLKITESTARRHINNCKAMLGIALVEKGKLF